MHSSDNAYIGYFSFYPAFMLSSVNPVEALRDDFKLGKLFR